MKPKKPLIIVLLALSLTPFASSIRALSQKITEELDLTYAKMAPALEASFPVPTAEAATVQPILPNLLENPQQLTIPSIGLNVAIGSVGLTPSGNMGVLNNPKKVSWYKNGPVPGVVGSAVIAAHVFQSFANLKNVKIGNSIYVEQADGSELRFVVSEIELYSYTATKPLAKIFNRTDKARLNLITCAGKLTPDHLNYDHRLVVFAELAG